MRSQIDSSHDLRAMRRITMRIVLPVALVLVLVSANVRAQDAAAIAHGQKVYAAQKCAACHSIADKGNRKGPLDDIGSKLTADEIREWIVNAEAMSVKTKATRKPPMKDFAKLPKEDVDALVLYLQSLKKS
jgi:mono/diheme cytochrome c family protein